MADSDEDVKPDVSVNDNEETEEEKPAVEPKEGKPEKKQISIKVISQDGAEIAFKVSENVKMQKLMETTAKRWNTDLIGLRFLINGKTRVRKDDTPASLNLHETEENEIEVHTEQLGG